MRAALDVDIPVFPVLCPTLNNEIMNYLGGGSSDVSWTAGGGWSLLGLGCGPGE